MVMLTSPAWLVEGIGYLLRKARRIKTVNVVPAQTGFRTVLLHFISTLVLPESRFPVFSSGLFVLYGRQ